MRTLIIIVGGLVLLAILVLVGKIAGGRPSALALYFIPVWLAAAAANMWVGVSQAGYSVGEELPIFLVIFAIPAIAALLVWRKLSGT